MNKAVVYASRGGNTKKVADAIAKAIGVTAQPVLDGLQQPVDLLFLGGALYAGGLHADLTAFLAALSPDKAKTVVVFSTAAGTNTIFAQVRDALAPKGIAVDERVFSCRGRFLLAHMGRPNATDLAAAAQFAREVCASAE